MKRGIILILLLIINSNVFAHSAGASGFSSGLLHPVLGMDHFLAIFAAGAIGALLGGRATWLLPVIFISVMAIGGLLAMHAVPLASVETGITLSVILSGLAIMYHQKLGSSVAIAVFAVFAVYHGYAHGIEMPMTASPWLYASGFISGTAAILLSGVAIVLLAMRRRSRLAVSCLGGAVAMAGSVFLLVS